MATSFNHKTVITRATKTGATITDNGHQFRAENEGRVLIWYKQGDRAICLHTPSKHTDIMTDCFCDRHYYKLTEAINHLKAA